MTELNESEIGPFDGEEKIDYDVEESKETTKAKQKRIQDEAFDFLKRNFIQVKGAPTIDKSKIRKIEQFDIGKFKCKALSQDSSECPDIASPIYALPLPLSKSDDFGKCH